uniref:Uncharacterized protein n=1 Tax=Trichobilharzia regenti TaxID=157069 RepID=A0AA85JBV7_TRIRE|nr:unnamed protein product [Trichobilharzia regenti]
MYSEMDDDFSRLLTQTYLLEGAFGPIIDYLPKLARDLGSLKESLCLLSKTDSSSFFVLPKSNRASTETELNTLITSMLEDSSVIGQLIRNFYCSHENSDFVNCLKSAVIEASKPTQTTNCDISDILIKKQLDHVRAFLSNNSNRQLKASIPQKCTIQTPHSRASYLNSRIMELKSRIEDKKIYLSDGKVDTADLESLLADKRKSILRLHEKSENLLSNLPSLCEEVKHMKHELSNQINETINKCPSDDLLKRILQKIIKNGECSGNRTVAERLCANSLYTGCCRLFALDEHDVTTPNIILKSIRSLVQESSLAREESESLDNLLMTLEGNQINYNKVREEDKKSQTKLLEDFDSNGKKLEEAINETKDIICFIEEYLPRS